MNLKTNEIIILVLFLIGLLFCMNYKTSDLVEGFGETNENCPNILVKKGKELHLMNTRKTFIPGVNPIRFNNLEEYAQYVKWAQQVGIKCPVLYYEQTYDVQNNRGYRLLNDPLEPKAGLSSQMLLDSSRDEPPYNQNNYSGFDADDQYIGVKTPLDKIKVGNLEGEEGSANPMDPKWCGHKCTQKAVDAGAFKKRTREIKNPTDDKLSENMPRRY